jgi:FkbM family methyltransferase
MSALGGKRTLAKASSSGTRFPAGGPTSEEEIEPLDASLPDDRLHTRKLLCYPIAMFGAVGVMTGVIWSHPANRGRRVRALAKSAAWQLYKRTIARPFDIGAFGFRFRCYPDSHDAGRMIYFNGLPDPQEMEFVRRYVRPGDRVIDAGANVGVYSLFFASLVGTDGSVLAFEPDPKAVGRLRENVAINGASNIIVREAAVSSSSGTAAFTQGADTGNALYSVRTYDRPPQFVEVTTLDQEISGSYALGKMDIEGAEFDALEAAGKSLGAANPPVWLIEMSEKMLARSGHSVADVKKLLGQFGYRLWRYRPDSGKLIPFLSQDRMPGHVGDGIAIADTALEMVKDRLIAPPPFLHRGGK